MFREQVDFALDAKASADQSDPLQFSVGYRRDIAAIVPKKCEPTCPEAGKNQGEDEEGTSLISLFIVEGKKRDPKKAQWPGDIVIYNNFASGLAATKLSKVRRPSTLGEQGTDARRENRDAGEDPTDTEDTSASGLLDTLFTPLY